MIKEIKEFSSEKKKRVSLDKLIYELDVDEKIASLIGNDNAFGEIIIPQTIQFQSQSYIVSTIKEDSFFNSMIEFISIPKSIVDLKNGWCKGTKKLNSIKIDPENERYICFNGSIIIGKTNIESQNYDIIVFARRNIQIVKIPTFIKKIQSYSFSETQIEQIYFPSSIKEIGDGAFYDCRKLQRVEVSSNSEINKIGKDVFAGTLIKVFNVIPDGLNEKKDSSDNGIQLLEQAIKESINLQQNEIQTPQLNNDEDIFNDKFLLHCYFTHRIKTYSDYHNLKKEMEKEQPKLANVTLDVFKDKCQTAFSFFKAQEQYLLKTHTNFIDLIDDEFRQNIGSQQFNFNSQYNSVQSGIIQKKGPWSRTETDNLINTVIEKFEDIIDEDKKINWIKVAKFINGRSAKACYDKFKSIPKSQIILLHQKHKLIHNLNPIFLAAFTDFEENELLQEILNRIDNKEKVTLYDVSSLAFKKYYSPMSIATKYIVLKSIHNGHWPFDEQGNITIDDFSNKVNNLLQKAQDEPQELMNDVYMKQFTASFTWCRSFLTRHRLSLRKPHNERRGQINTKFIKKYLLQLAKAFKKYGIKGVINMDETFVHTYYYDGRVVARTNEGTCEVVRGSKFNSKEGTTIIATSMKDNEERIPLAIVAKGRSEVSEKNMKLTKMKMMS